MYLLFLCLGAILEVVGDLYLKKWTLGQATIYPGIIFYAVGSAFWMAALKNHDLSKAIIVFVCLNVIFAVMVGVFFLKEESSLSLWLGLILCLVGMILAEV